jgi:hypothetical protein
MIYQAVFHGSLISKDMSVWLESDQKKDFERDLGIIWSNPSNVCFSSIIHRENYAYLPYFFCILELLKLDQCSLAGEFPSMQFSYWFCCPKMSQDHFVVFHAPH